MRKDHVVGIVIGVVGTMLYLRYKQTGRLFGGKQQG